MNEVIRCKYIFVDADDINICATNVAYPRAIQMARELGVRIWDNDQDRWLYDPREDRPDYRHDPSAFADYLNNIEFKYFKRGHTHTSTD